MNITYIFYINQMQDEVIKLNVHILKAQTCASAIQKVRLSVAVASEGIMHATMLKYKLL